MSANDQRLMSLYEARDVFTKALTIHEDFVYKLGYEAGFAAGWDALVRQLASSKPDMSQTDDNRERAGQPQGSGNPHA